MRGGAERGVLVGVVQVHVLAVEPHANEHGAEVRRARRAVERRRQVGDDRHAGGEDERRPEPGGPQHGVEQHGAVGAVAVTFLERPVGGRDGGKRQFVQPRPGEADLLRDEIADGGQPRRVVRGALDQRLRLPLRRLLAGGGLGQFRLDLRAVALPVPRREADGRQVRPGRREQDFRLDAALVRRGPLAAHGPLERLRPLAQRLREVRLDGQLDAGRDGDAQRPGPDRVRAAERDARGEERPVLADALDLVLDHAADLDARQADDERLGGRVARRRPGPLGVHQVLLLPSARTSPSRPGPSPWRSRRVSSSHAGL